MVERCPLCGGELAGNVCMLCCYTLPQDGELAALYDLDPDDYPQESPVREIIPEHISEEIYPNRELKNIQNVQAYKPIVVKVRKRNMQLTNGYKPNARLKVKRIEPKRQKSSERSVPFWDSMVDCGWLLIIVIFSPTLATVALVAAAIKMRGRLSGKFVALVFAAQILRIIIVQILLSL